MKAQPNEAFTVRADRPGERLDVLLARLSEVSRERVKAAIAAGDVTVDKKVITRSAHRVEAGALLTLILPPALPPRALPEAIPLRVVHEDAALVVIDKPAGMVVHPAAGHPSGTLVNALLGRLGSLPGPEPFRPGIVHRLDKDTSGLLVVARTATAREALMAQLKARTMHRHYLALATRAPDPPEGTVDAPIGRDPKNRLRMAVVASGKPAVTHYRTLRLFPTGEALLEATLDTGRTHQIRVHMARLHCPLVGDRLYGGTASLRQALHAYRLAFVHPESREPVAFSSPLPPDFQEMVRRVREQPPQG